ncbi:hypothetical protein PIB30_115092, partial [Stylosanthes scabra]|nr:hypothetical protein [Stylosanthes scabra]
MHGRHSASMSSQSCSNTAPSPEDLRICVEVHAYAWKSTHMRGSPRICVESYLSHVLEKQT